MQHAGLDEAQAGLKIARTNINNLWYADDTKIMAESKDELKSFLFKVIEESKNFVLKLNIQKIRPWQIAVEIMETETNFILGSSKITAGADYSHEIKRCLFLERKAVTNLDSRVKSRDITLVRKVHLVKAMCFPVVMNRCNSWTIKKAEHWRTGAFKYSAEDSWESLGQQDQTSQS